MHASDPQFNEKMKQAAKILNLKEHLVGISNPVLLHSCGDIEGTCFLHLFQVLSHSIKNRKKKKKKKKKKNRPFIESRWKVLLIRLRPCNASPAETNHGLVRTVPSSYIIIFFLKNRYIYLLLQGNGDIFMNCYDQSWLQNFLNR